MKTENETTGAEEATNSSNNTPQIEAPLTVSFDSDALTNEEDIALRKYEEVIEDGLKTFLEVGNALIDIHDQGLYKQYGSIEKYCLKRWSFGKAQAYRLMDAARTYPHVSPIGNTPTLLPSCEAQVRPLVGLKPNEARTAWNNAVAAAGDKPVTAKAVQKEAAKFKHAAPVKVKQTIAEVDVPEHEVDREDMSPHDLAFMNMDGALKDLKMVKELDKSQKKDWKKLFDDIKVALGGLGVEVGK